MIPTQPTYVTRLIDQLEAYLKPTGEHQAVVVVERRFLVKVKATLVAYDAERIGDSEQQDETEIESS